MLFDNYLKRRNFAMILNNIAKEYGKRIRKGSLLYFVDLALTSYIVLNVVSGFIPTIALIAYFCK